MSDFYVQNGQQWAAQLQASNPASSGMADVWAAGHTGSLNTVVGVVDTGVNYTHEDLYLNIWINQAELPNLAVIDVNQDGLITLHDLNAAENSAFVTDVNANGRIDAGDLLNDVRWENGVDEDGNGRTDDLIGWDFYNNDNDPMDDNGHGTHVAGTIGAIGDNGEGVAGVNWNIQMAVYKMSGADARGFMSMAGSAISHFTQAAMSSDTGQRFVGTNHSWGSTSSSTSLQAAIDAANAQGILTVASAGNSSRDIDVTPQYPASMTGVVTVAATDVAGNLTWFSNYGDAATELAAPGQDIISTVLNGYGYMSGTSMATPHVMGALALAADAFPTATAAQLLAALQQTYDTASLLDHVASGGTLDMVQMFAYLAALTAPVGQLITGTTASDTLAGGSGPDTISGVPTTGNKLGHGTLDVLAGGGGEDAFILGDDRGAFYNDGNPAAAGMNHYARIMDFTAEDTLVVSSEYAIVLRTDLVRFGYTGLGVYADTNGSGTWNSTDEMIAHLVGFSGQPTLVLYGDFIA